MAAELDAPLTGNAGVVAGHLKPHGVQQPVVDGVQLRAHAAPAAGYDLVKERFMVQGQRLVRQDIQVFKGHRLLVGLVDAGQSRQIQGNRLFYADAGQVSVHLFPGHFRSVVCVVINHHRAPSPVVFFVCLEYSTAIFRRQFPRSRRSGSALTNRSGMV